MSISRDTVMRISLSPFLGLHTEESTTSQMLLYQTQIRVNGLQIRTSRWHSPNVLVYMGPLPTYLLTAVPSILTLRYVLSILTIREYSLMSTI